MRRFARVLLGRVAVAVLLAATASGCAAMSARTPTPAAQVRFQELETPPPPTGERYYALVFGSQSHPKVAKYTHTWATAVRVLDQGPDKPPVIQPHTISWMPASLDVRICRFWIEPGVDLDLHTTMQLVLSQEQRVSVWGPYEIRPGIYRKFLMQKEFIDSGQVGYQAVDVIGEAALTGYGCDCIHAITDADAMFPRGYYPLRRFGDDASQFIVNQLLERGAVLDPGRTHDWLIPTLKLDQYPIHRR